MNPAASEIPVTSPKLTKEKHTSCYSKQILEPVTSASVSDSVVDCIDGHEKSCLNPQSERFGFLEPHLDEWADLRLIGAD